MTQVYKKLFLLINWCHSILRTFYFPSRSNARSSSLNHRKVFFILVCLLFLGFTNLHAQKKVRIGIITDGYYWENPLILKAIKKELSVLVANRYQVEYPPASQITGNFDNDLIQRHIQNLLERDDLDLIIALGNLSVKNIIGQKELKIPVVTPYVDFPFVLGFLDENTLSPKNSYWTTTFDPSFQSSIFVTLKKILQFKSITYICSNQLCENNHLPPVLAKGESLFEGRFVSIEGAIPVRTIPTPGNPVIFTLEPEVPHSFLSQTDEWLRIPQGWVLKSDVEIKQNDTLSKASLVGSNNLIGLLNQLSTNVGLNSNVLSISPENFIETLEGINTDMAVVGNLYGFSEEQVSRVYSLLKEKKTPSITLQGQKGIEQGALIAVTQKSYQEIGKTNAVKINMVLSGIPLADIPVTDRMKIDLTFNLDTAKEIDFEIPLQHYYESRLYTKNPGKKGMSLARAIEIALKGNHQVTILQQQLNQANSNIDVAMSAYKPQIGSKLAYSQIDETRADLSPSPVTQTRAELSLTQSLWNPEADGMIDLVEIGKELLINNRDHQLKLIQERVIREYLNILMYREIVLLRKRHLLINNQLKEIAKLRFDLKATGKTDVLRAEISYENAQLEMANSIETLQQAQVSFRNLLGLPGNSDIKLDPGEFSVQKNISNPFSRYRTSRELSVLEDVLLEHTLEASRELKIINRQIEQAALEKKQIDQKYQPKIQAGVSWFHQLSDQHRDFTAVEKALGAEDKYDEANTTGWSLQLSLSFPIFTGGRHGSELETANFRTLELMGEQKKLEGNILNRARNNIIAFYNNQRRLEITRSKLESTKESYDLGYESYKEGAITMMELLDFQSMVFLTEIGLTATRYKVIHSLVDVLKLIDKMDMLHKSTEEILIFSNQIHQEITDRIKAL